MDFKCSVVGCKTGHRHRGASNFGGPVGNFNAIDVQHSIRR